MLNKVKSIEHILYKNEPDLYLTVLFRHNLNILQVYFNEAFLLCRTFMVEKKMHIFKMSLLLAMKTQFGKEWFALKMNQQGMWELNKVKKHII